MKTIKDLKNYVKKTSRYLVKDYLDPMCFYQSEYNLLMEERNKVKKNSKKIFCNPTPRGKLQNNINSKVLLSLYNRL